MSLRPWVLPAGLAICAIGALVSALPQLQGLAAIGVAPPLSTATRILFQGVVFSPLLLFILMRPNAAAVNVSWISNSLSLFLLCFAVIYPHFPSPFFDYVWDVALIETIFVYLISQSLTQIRGTEKFAIWPLRLLFFKLMFCMGVVKFLYGMPEWRNFTAMKFFWANQPMPGFLAWYAALLPDWVQRLMTIYVFVVEIPGSLLIFAGPRARAIFFWLNVVLQLGIFVSGNYGFFNLLTILLSFSLFENTLDCRFQAAPWGSTLGFRRILSATIIVLSFGWLATTAWYVLKCIQPGQKYLHETSWVFLKNEAQAEMLAPVRGVLKLFAGAKVSNPYALFGMIPKYRMEIGLEGSNDGKDWKRYAFKVRPDATSNAPIWYAPHHWRLDHQFYYESFRIRDVKMHEEYSFFLGVRWMPNFIGKLFEGDLKVASLLSRNPFPDQPPAYLRFKYLYYRFTTAAERSRSGDYWNTEPPHAGQFYEAVLSRDNYRQLP